MTRGCARTNIGRIKAFDPINAYCAMMLVESLDISELLLKKQRSIHRPNSPSPSVVSVYEVMHGSSGTSASVSAA